jgi:hypothetical protein
VAETLNRGLSIRDERWVRWLAWGICLIAVSAIGEAVCGLGLVLGPFLMVSGGGFAVGMVGCQAVLVAGLWLFVKPDPRGRVVARSNVSGWIGRGAATAHLLGGLDVGLRFRFPQSQFVSGAEGVLLWMFGSALVGALVFAIRCLVIGRWLPAKVLSWQLVVVAPGLVAALSGVAAIMLFVPYDEPAGPFLNALSLALPFLLLVLMLWLPVALICFAMALQRRVQRARRVKA